MNLEQELRAVLLQEADMRTTPTPDIDSIVIGGESRLRRRTTTRIGLAAAAVALVGGGVYGATQLGDFGADAGVTNRPGEPTDAVISELWPDNDMPIPADTYRTLVGFVGAGNRIVADFTLDGDGWRGSNYPVAFADEDFAGLGVYLPESVAGGCLMAAGLEEAATTPRQLVQQLLRMPRSEVVEQPARTEAFGGSAVHLRLRIDAACDGGAYYQVAETPTGGRGISYLDEPPRDEPRMVIIDFWVMDVDGVAVVVDRFHLEDAPHDLVAQSTRAVESITFIEAE